MFGRALVQTLESPVCVFSTSLPVGRTNHFFSNKAVADGTVFSYIDPLVTSRTPRYTYGIDCVTVHNPSRTVGEKDQVTISYLANET
ncbi:hypothetical protein OG21DRAFT_255289 [Imleria badia]|nr:hypothetical protein OG21DRAFT_255289 [Imleria badia]